MSISDMHAQDVSFKISEILELSYTPGLSLTTISNGTISDSYTLGYKSTDSKSAVTDNTVFSAASLSKCIFSYMVIELNRQGIIDLDKPLLNYFNYEDIVHDKRAKSVTARMVLSHNSGLPNWRSGKLEFKHDPGSKFGYSGEGFVWLQRTIEHITGSGLEKLAQKMVFKPLGMTRSSYVFLDEFDDDYAIPHDNRMKSKGKFKIKDANAAHSLQTTSKDYAKFMIALIDRKNQMIHEIQDSVSSNALGNISWGLGVGLQITAQGKEVWHWGDNGTFKAYFTINPDTREGLVYFANGSNGLSCTAELVQLFIDAPQPSVTWNDYAHYKSPSFMFPINAEKWGVEEAMKPFLNKDGMIDSSKVSFRTVGWAAWQWLQSRELDLAGPLLLKMKGAYSDEPRIPFNTIRYHLMTGNTTEAITSCDEALQSYPEEPSIIDICKQITNPPIKGSEFFLSGYENAKMVSVVGPFNDWEETANICQWINGGWRCFIDLKPGEYEYKFRIDGVNILDPVNEQSNHHGNYHVSVREIK